MSKIPDSVWARGRKEYETAPGTTYQDVGEIVGCTRQAVYKRSKKEGWLKAAPLPESLENAPCVKPVAGSALGLRSPDNVAKLINNYALTGSKATACRSVGIDNQTLYNWCEETPELSVEMQMARDAMLLGQVSKIVNANDWKAAKEVLSRAPETREVWGETQEKGPRIILNIHRDEVIIDQ